MTNFAIYQNVQRGSCFEREYIAYCKDNRNLSRMSSGVDNCRKGTGVADFVRKDGTHAPRQFVHFSCDKAAQAAIAELVLPVVQVDEFCNCEIPID